MFWWLWGIYLAATGSRNLQESQRRQRATHWCEWGAASSGLMSGKNYRKTPWISSIQFRHICWQESAYFFSKRLWLSPFKMLFIVLLVRKSRGILRFRTHSVPVIWPKHQTSPKKPQRHLPAVVQNGGCPTRCGFPGEKPCEKSLSGCENLAVRSYGNPSCSQWKEEPFGATKSFPTTSDSLGSMRSLLNFHGRIHNSLQKV